MNEVQENGEPKKIFLTKPPENPTIVNEPTTSAVQFKSLRNWSSGDHQVRIPPRRHMPPVDKYADEHLSNHKKQRYWNSWEELHLVELWRRYKDEVVINMTVPVYRKMMIAMRNRNMVVTAQDCRRKINNINTRYKQELQRMELTGSKSEWRLFPLVHCVYQPKIKEFDPWQELAIINKLLNKIPKPVEIPTTFYNNTVTNNNFQIPQTQVAPTTTTHSNVSCYQPRNAYQTSRLSANLSTAVLAVSSPINLLASSHDRFEKMSILPFRNITLEKVEQLRQDNNRLAQQRDADLQCLHMEEHNLRSFEEFIRTWTQQKEIELKRIQVISVRNVISIENAENHNVEQQLQATIITK